MIPRPFIRAVAVFLVASLFINSAECSARSPEHSPSAHHTLNSVLFQSQALAASLVAQGGIGYPVQRLRGWRLVRTLALQTGLDAGELRTKLIDPVVRMRKRHGAIEYLDKSGTLVWAALQTPAGLIHVTRHITDPMSYALVHNDDTTFFIYQLWKDGKRVDGIEGLSQRESETELLWSYHDEPGHARECSLDILSIRRSFQKQGIGETLILWLAKRAADDGYRVFSTTTKNPNLMRIMERLLNPGTLQYSVRDALLALEFDEDTSGDWFPIPFTLLPELLNDAGRYGPYIKISGRPILAVPAMRPIRQWVLRLAACALLLGLASTAQASLPWINSFAGLVLSHHMNVLIIGALISLLMATQGFDWHFRPKNKQAASPETAKNDALPVHEVVANIEEYLGVPLHEHEYLLYQLFDASAHRSQTLTLQQFGDYALKWAAVSFAAKRYPNLSNTHLQRFIQMMTSRQNQIDAFKPLLVYTLYSRTGVSNRLNPQKFMGTLLGILMVLDHSEDIERVLRPFFEACAIRFELEMMAQGSSYTGADPLRLPFLNLNDPNYQNLDPSRPFTRFGRMHRSLWRNSVSAVLGDALLDYVVLRALFNENGFSISHQDYKDLQRPLTNRDTQVRIMNRVVGPEYQDVHAKSIHDQTNLLEAWVAVVYAKHGGLHGNGLAAVESFARSLLRTLVPEVSRLTLISKKLDNKKSQRKPEPKPLGEPLWRSIMKGNPNNPFFVVILCALVLSVSSHAASSRTLRSAA